MIPPEMPEPIAELIRQHGAEGLVWHEYAGDQPGVTEYYTEWFGRGEDEDQPGYGLCSLVVQLSKAQVMVDFEQPGSSWPKTANPELMAKWFALATDPHNPPHLTDEDRARQCDWRRFAGLEGE